MPLHITCNYGDTVAVLMLLEHGADVTAAGVSHHTLLIMLDTVPFSITCSTADGYLFPCLRFMLLEHTSFCACISCPPSTLLLLTIHAPWQWHLHSTHTWMLTQCFTELMLTAHICTLWDFTVIRRRTNLCTVSDTSSGFWTDYASRVWLGNL